MLRAQTANNIWQRSMGLMGRARLGREEAFCIPHCRQVHTAFMNFAIDAVFVDAAQTVLWVETLPPWRISRRVPPAVACYELLAGEAGRREICIGDTFRLNF